MRCVYSSRDALTKQGGLDLFILFFPDEILERGNAANDDDPFVSILRVEAIPDITPLMRPTKLGDFATYFFFGLGGTMLGGELGLLTGTWSASRSLSKDPASWVRIEKAYRAMRVDFLRKEAARLESDNTSSLRI